MRQVGWTLVGMFLGWIVLSLVNFTDFWGWLISRHSFTVAIHAETWGHDHFFFGCLALLVSIPLIAAIAGGVVESRKKRDREYRSKVIQEYEAEMRAKRPMMVFKPGDVIRANDVNKAFEHLAVERFEDEEGV